MAVKTKCALRSSLIFLRNISLQNTASTNPVDCSTSEISIRYLHGGTKCAKWYAKNVRNAA